MMRIEACEEKDASKGRSAGRAKIPLKGAKEERLTSRAATSYDFVTVPMSRKKAVMTWKRKKEGFSHRLRLVCTLPSSQLLPF